LRLPSCPCCCCSCCCCCCCAGCCADGPLAAYRELQLSACMCASLNQRRNLLLRTCHALCMDVSEGAVREGGFFLEPRGRPTGLFPASPLAFASSSCSCPAAEQPAFQLGTGASRTQPGGSHWRAWSSFRIVTLKTTRNN